MSRKIKAATLLMTLIFSSHQIVELCFIATSLLSPAPRQQKTCDVEAGDLDFPSPLHLDTVFCSAVLLGHLTWQVTVSASLPDKRNIDSNSTTLSALPQELSVLTP